MLPDEIQWKANENFILRAIGGECVLVPIGEVPDPRLENCMISLNETCAFLWRLFAEKPMTEKEAVKAARIEYDAPPGEIETHIHGLIAEYSKLGLLVKEDS